MAKFVWILSWLLLAIAFLAVHFRYIWLLVADFGRVLGQ